MIKICLPVKVPNPLVIAHIQRYCGSPFLHILPNKAISMAYNELLAERLRATLDAKGIAYTERKCVCGLCFLHEGKMCVGIVKDELDGPRPRPRL
ncbi:MAG: hypothetical protein R3B47_10620 [Bacteroidia bacterium]